LAAIAKRRTSILRAVLLVCCCAVVVAARGQSETEDTLAKSIVEKADEARFPKDAFEVTVSLTSTLEDGGTEARKYRIL